MLDVHVSKAFLLVSPFWVMQHQKLSLMWQLFVNQIKFPFTLKIFRNLIILLSGHLVKCGPCGRVGCQARNCSLPTSRSEGAVRVAWE
jgi:hypothetical protein